MTQTRTIDARLETLIDSVETPITLTYDEMGRLHDLLMDLIATSNFPVESYGGVLLGQNFICTDYVEYNFMSLDKDGKPTDSAHPAAYKLLAVRPSSDPAVQDENFPAEKKIIDFVKNINYLR